MQQEIERRTTTTVPFALLHVDINHLRHYNERFGFGRGDEVINVLAETLTSTVKALDSAHALVGHLGGRQLPRLVLRVEDRTDRRPP